ncbi:hypothetical protein OSTOST_17709, partial [Ostertagia ostertagi]
NNPNNNPEPTEEQPRYHFRNRRLINYSDDQYERGEPTRFNTFSVSLLLHLISTFCITTVWASSNLSSQYNVHCIEGGVQLTVLDVAPYELCADQYCVEFGNPSKQETVIFPPQATDDCSMVYHYLGVRQDKPAEALRRRQLAEIIAIVTLLIPLTRGCQTVDLSEHYSTISHSEGRHKIPSTAIVELTPNLPIQWKSFSLTLTSLALPPTPLFNTYFISDAIRTAIWKREYHVALRCPDINSARRFDCPAVDNCVCTPAENHVNCRCSEFSITGGFNNTRNQLPVVFPALTFLPHPIVESSGKGFLNGYCRNCHHV